MKNTAIKGHRTRGSEIIELLEMLGGTNWPYSKYFGNEPTLVYYINDHGYISADEINDSSRCTIYTLEEFLEKYPYKVGDKVLYHDSKAYIKSMKWGSREIIYTVEWEKELWETTVFYLQPYKEAVEENLTIQDIRDNNAEWLLNKLQEMSVKKVLQTISDLYDKLHKPQYPKTYKECFNICFGNHHHVIQVVGLDGLGNNKELFENFIKLKICRDAYWKMAGEQMGLGKPWEPNWNSGDQERYGIIKLDDNGYQYAESTSFVFPTEEMRDVFYENFKDLIESCKELL